MYSIFYGNTQAQLPDKLLIRQSTFFFLPATSPSSSFILHVSSPDSSELLPGGLAHATFAPAPAPAPPPYSPTPAGLEEGAQGEAGRPSSGDGSHVVQGSGGGGAARPGQGGGVTASLLARRPRVRVGGDSFVI